MKRSYLFSARTGQASRTARTLRAALGVASGVAMLAALAGCSSSPPLFLPDGRPTTLVQCPEGSDSCAQQARANCGGQFDTVRQSKDDGTLSLIYACPARSNAQ
jgi:predicted small lipoprotein YifL